MMKIFCHSLCAPLACLGILLAWRSPALATQATWTTLQGTTPAQVRITWWHAPASSATISWSTETQTQVNLVRLTRAGGLLEGDSSSDIVVESSRDGLYSGSAATGGAYYHHARVQGLAAGTRYDFVVESDGELSRRFHWRTAPKADPGEQSSFTLLYGGDSRTAHADRLRMNSLIAQLIGSDEALLAFVHGGDFVMRGDRWPDWELWLSHHEVATGADGRILPVVPARGNHDIGALYDEVFDEPGGAGLNYGAMRVGSELALVTLNTNISTAGDQALWMEANLPLLRASHRWLLAQYHQPMWPALKAPSPAKDLWVPLFEASDLDLVLESDGHVLKRTVPIRDGKHDESGVTYIGEGGLGAPLRLPKRDFWYLQSPGMTAPGLHITLLEVSPEELVIRTLGPAISETDFEPEGAREVLGSLAPWQVLIDGEVAQDWFAVGLAEGESAASRDWHTESSRSGAGGLARAWVRLPAEVLAGASELMLQVPRGVPLEVWLDGVSVARRAAWRSGPWWQYLKGRFAVQPVEYLALRSPGGLAAGQGVSLAIEIGLSPRARAGAGPRIELLADPVNLDDLSSSAPRLLDLWRLQPRLNGR